MRVVIILLVTVLAIAEWVRSDDVGTNFFLKASKSVPRIGRRGMHQDFIKASKSVPRIGRRGDDAIEAAAGKRYFSEKDIAESGPVGLTDVMQGDEPYRDQEQYPDRPLFSW